jgi:hypothetical protein
MTKAHVLGSIASIVSIVGAAACSSGQPATRPPTTEALVTTPGTGGAPGGSAIGKRSETPTVPEGSLASKDSKQVAKTLLKVSELRGIASSKPVPGVKLERDELVARVKEKALREYPPAALRREGLLLQLVGFAPPTFDYLGEMLKLLEAQLEGFYEPKNGTMYLAADLKGAQAQATLAHELVHALQDQKWDLKKRSDYKPGRGDESMALACLAEGDATSLMLDYVMKPDKSALDIPDEALRELMKSGMNMGDVQSVPHILRSTLVAPYMEGIGFVNELRRKGGWPAVDRAWDRLPTTTEQILHIEKWETREAALTIPAPTALALGEGWKLDDEDTFGELGFALTFAEWMDVEDARKAAAGWGGDRTAVYTKGDQIAFAVHLRYDASGGQKQDAQAERAFAKLSPALKKSLASTKPSASDASLICFDRKDLGPLLFARKDRELVMITGPAKIASGAWTSAGNCSTAKKWSDEVTAQK